MDRVDLAAPGMRATPPRGAAARGPAARRRLQPHARPPRGGAPRGRPRRPARPGAGARAHRPGPPRRGQPGADRDPAAARGDDDATRRPRCARSCRRPSGSPPRRWRSCCTSPASCARPRSTTTACPRARLAGRRLRRAHRHPRALPPPRRSVPTLTDEEQLVIYRVTQESLSNVAQHSGATHVDVELSFVGRTVLRVARRRLAASTTGAGQRPRAAASAASALRHARARAARRRPPRPSSPRPARAPPSN